MKKQGKLKQIMIIRDVFVILLIIIEATAMLVRIKALVTVSGFVLVCLLIINAKDSRLLMKNADSEDERDHYLFCVFIPHIAASFCFFVLWIESFSLHI